MAGPITWRTVNGPSLAEAGRPMESAQRSFDNAFTGLGGVLKQQEATDQANWNQIKENNTQDFLNKLYSAQGAEGFKALQDSGELDRMLAANGAQIDRAAARSALDGRLATLQQRDVAGINYKNTMDDAAQAPEVRRISMLTLTDPDAAAAELAAKPDLRAAVQLAQGIDARKQTLTDRDRANTRFTWDTDAQKWKADDAAQKELLRPFEVQAAQSKLDTEAQQRAASRAQAALAGAQATALTSKAEEDAAARRAAADRQILANALKDNPFANGVLNPGSSEELAKLANNTKLGSGGSPEKLAKTMERLTKLANEGIEITTRGPDGKPIKTKVPVPLDLAKAALLGSTDTLLSWNEGYADTFEDTIRKRMTAVTSVPSPNGGAPVAVNPYVQGYSQYQRILDAGASVPAPKKK
jgi:hypothetical protein